MFFHPSLWNTLLPMKTPLSAAPRSLLASALLSMALAAPGPLAAAAPVVAKPKATPP